MKPGTAKKLTVCKALSNNEYVSQNMMNKLDDEECDYHLHLASTHYAATKKVSYGFCDSLEYATDVYKKQNKTTKRFEIQLQSFCS